MNQLIRRVCGVGLGLALLALIPGAALAQKDCILLQDCVVQPGPVVAGPNLWRLVAVIPSPAAGPTGTLTNGNTYVEQFARGVFTYTETARGRIGTCKIVVSFSDPPQILQSGTAPYRSLTATATVTATPLPPGSYYNEGFGATYRSDINNLPAQGVGWEGALNPGMANENAILVGCNTNYPKFGRTIWTISPPDRSLRPDFEIQGFVGNLLVTRWHYQKP